MHPVMGYIRWINTGGNFIVPSGIYNDDALQAYQYQKPHPRTYFRLEHFVRYTVISQKWRVKVDTKHSVNVIRQTEGIR